MASGDSVAHRRGAARCNAFNNHPLLDVTPRRNDLGAHRLQVRDLLLGHLRLLLVVGGCVRSRRGGAALVKCARARPPPPKQQQNKAQKQANLVRHDDGELVAAAAGDERERGAGVAGRRLEDVRDSWLYFSLFFRHLQHVQSHAVFHATTRVLVLQLQEELAAAGVDAGDCFFVVCGSGARVSRRCLLQVK